MGKLRDIIKDKDNKEKMEKEKTQQNDIYLENNKKMKELFSEHETIENEVKELLKKKNKLNNNLSSKEVEEDINKANRKSVLNNLKIEYKKSKEEVLQVLKKNKEVSAIIKLIYIFYNILQYLTKKEDRIKKLIIILNKLLIEYAKRSELAKKENVNANSNDEDNLDNILFDKNKSMNLKNISKNIVEEINNQITNL